MSMNHEASPYQEHEPSEREQMLKHIVGLSDFIVRDSGIEFAGNHEQRTTSWSDGVRVFTLTRMSNPNHVFWYSLQVEHNQETVRYGYNNYTSDLIVRDDDYQEITRLQCSVGYESVLRHLRSNEAAERVGYYYQDTSTNFQFFNAMARLLLDGGDFDGLFVKLANTQSDQEKFKVKAQMVDAVKALYCELDDQQVYRAIEEVFVHHFPDSKA